VTGSALVRQPERSKETLAESRKNNIDLAPLADYERLEVLFLNAQAQSIGSIGHLSTVTKLSLGGMGKKQSLSFVRTMNGLLSLMLTSALDR
jgi:hypothetical protein